MKNIFCILLKRAFLGSCILFLLLAGNAGADILYWNNNGLSNSISGTWDTNVAQWSTSQTPTDTPVMWVSTNAAGFPAATNGIQFLTITLDNAVDMSGSYNGFADGVATPLISVSNLVYTGDGALNIMPGLQAFYTAVATNNTIIRAAVTGTGGIQHQGAGSIYFSTSNSFSGGVSLLARSGANYNNNDSFGTGPITFDDPTSPVAQCILATPSVDSTATPFATVPITITNPISTFTNSGNAIIVGLAAAPTTFTGPITMRGAAGTTNTFDVRNSTFTMTGPISGEAHLRKLGTVVLVLSGSNTFSGRTIIGNGTLSVNSINSVVDGTPSSSLGAPTTPADGVIALGATTTAGILIYTGAGETTDRAIDLAGTTGGGTIQNDGTGAIIFTGNVTATGAGAKLLTLTGANASSNEISGIIVDNSAANPTSLTKALQSVWKLSGSNTFSGKTIISRGTLSIDSFNRVVSPAASSSLGRPTTVANGTINLGGGTTASALIYTGAGETTDRVINLTSTTGGNTIQNDGSGPLVLSSDFTATGNGAKTLTLSGSNTGDNRVNGQIVNSTGNTAVTKAGAGTWTLAASNGFSGNLTLTAGRLYIAHPAAMGAGTNVINGNGFFDNLTGADLTVTNAFTLSNGSPTYLGSSNNMTYTGPVTISGANRTITVTSNMLTLNSGIDDLAQNRAFTKAGAGTLRLLGANTYTGNTTVNAGTLLVGAAGSFATSNNFTLAASGTLDVSAIAAFTVPGTNVFTASGSNTVEGVSAAIIRGGTTVDLGTRPITLTFRPTSFNGDTGHPSLIVSQGTLALGGNVFTVNNASGTALGAGTYQLIQQSVGNINSTGSHTVSVTGSGLVAGASASIVVSGGEVNLVVTVAPTGATIGTPTILGDGSVQLNFVGTPNASYIIQAATNLNDPIVWFPLSTNTADNDGLFNFTDTEATNFNERYYRTENE